MNKSEAMKTVEALANGVDPVTGELFQENSPYNHPRVIRALFLSLRALESLREKQTRATGLPRNAGKPWTQDDDQILLGAFNQGINVIELAERQSRTRGAIAARLVRLGRISERSEVLGR